MLMRRCHQTKLFSPRPVFHLRLIISTRYISPHVECWCATQHVVWFAIPLRMLNAATAFNQCLVLKNTSALATTSPAPAPASATNFVAAIVACNLLLRPVGVSLVTI